MPVVLEVRRDAGIALRRQLRKHSLVELGWHAQQEGPQAQTGSRDTVVLRDELAELEVATRAFVHRQEVFPFADDIDTEAQFMIAGLLAPVIHPLELSLIVQTGKPLSGRVAHSEPTHRTADSYSGKTLGK